MTLPVVPGSSMSFSQINTELGLTSTALISLNDTAVRTLAGVGASPATIAITNLSGKANEFTLTISTNKPASNLRTLAIAAGWNGTSKCTTIINTGVYVYDGFTIDGSWPGGCFVTNNGFIMGAGGSGYAGTGGPAISLGVNVTLINNSYIGGGGGGGNGYYDGTSTGGGGGGAGGGYGGNSGRGVAGGAGGAPGSTGANGVYAAESAGKTTFSGAGGGGGGRIMPGTGGSGGTGSGGSNSYGRGGGSGGGGAGVPQGSNTGGAGGSAGAAGQGVGGSILTGGGGGWGAAGGRGISGKTTVAGGPGGKAIALNGYTATRSGSGTTYGTVS